MTAEGYHFFIVRYLTFEITNLRNFALTYTNVLSIGDFQRKDSNTERRNMLNSLTGSLGSEPWINFL